MSVKKPKLGVSATIAAQKLNSSSRAVEVQKRHDSFKLNFHLNGGNATQAAIAAGYSIKSAKVIGSQLLTRLNLRTAASEGVEAAFEKSELSTSRTLEQLRRIVEFDPRQLYDADGVLIPIHRLPEEVASVIASMDVDNIYSGTGAKREVVGYTSKVRQWDKLVAIKLAMQNLGLFEKDNRQKDRSLTIQVGLVAAPTRREDES